VQSRHILALLVMFVGIVILMMIVEGVKEFINNHRKLSLFLFCAGSVTLWVALRYPEISQPIFNTTATYTGGALALAVVVFIWTAPFITVVLLMHLFFKAVATSTANEIERRQKEHH
jgi:hypothetical protein